MITNKIVSATPQANYRIDVAFKNGIQGVFDMTPYLHEGVFQKLRDPAFFKSVRVDYGTLVWPEDIDIAPDTVEAELIQEK
ncbi:MAG: DUF2442 domain-containing protein [Fibrobacterota bacterium]